MKKIITVVLIIIGFVLINIKAYASSWEFKWSNTVIHIPVGDELSKYVDLPKAILLKDGKALTDAHINYLREGDWLYFLSNVDTTKAGIYKVWYKAQENDKYRPGTCVGYKNLITFYVEDTITPTLTILSKDINIKRMNKIDASAYNIKSLLESNVKVKDNYSNCSLNFNNNLDLTKCGTYKINVIATDSSNNKTEDYFNINVYDEGIPIINFYATNDLLIIPLGAMINMSDYFTAYDSIDGDISSKIIYPSIDTTKEAEFDYTVTVKNNNDTMASKTIRVKVIDDVAPILELTANSIILDYQTDLNDFNYLRYIEELSDNKEIDMSNLTITTDLENKVGIYHINYEYNDGVNVVLKHLEVKMISHTSPSINAYDIETEVSSNINLLDYIEVIDDSDPYVNQRIEIDDSEVNYKEKGIYYANVYVANSSGLASASKIKISVIDNTFKNSVNVSFFVFVIIFSVISVALIVFLVIFLIKKFRKSSNLEPGL